MSKTAVTIFFADTARCAEWDAQLLADYPNLTHSADQSWRTKPGWYWRYRNVRPFCVARWPPLWPDRLSVR
jgi:hypothetical protein